MTDKVTHSHATKHKPNCGGNGSTPCGWACIAKGKRCVDSLEADAKALAERLIEHIMGTEASKVGTKLSAEEAQAVTANSEFLSKATVAEVQARAFSFGKNDLGQSYVEPTAAILDSVWKGLDSPVRRLITKKGSLAKDQYWDPTSESGYGGMNADRAKLIIAMYVKQNGRCAYTGLPIDLRNSDLEHIEPISTRGRSAESPDNFVLIRRAINSSKQDFPLHEWAEGFEGRAAKSAVKNAKRSASDSSALRDLVAQTAPNEWTDKAIQDFGIKFYYANPPMGLLSTVASNSRTANSSGARTSYGRPAVKVGRPITLAMAKALREGDSQTADKIRAADKEIMGATGLLAGKQITKDEHQAILNKYKGLIY